MNSKALVMPFNPEALNKIQELLSSVGLSDCNHFGYSAQNPKSYRFGGLEWTERGKGMRFILNLGNSGRVNEIRVYNLDSRYIAFPEEKLVEIREEISEILAKFNS